jgi:superfamily II DNA or RNA helicase
VLLREDRDFHSIQMVEAAIDQYLLLKRKPEAVNVLVAAARYLAAHSPTVRAQGQTYQIARRFLVPAITHQTKTKERRRILERFHTGECPVVVTSQVLNEGVDVPAANVGIVLSGTGSVREHVQRLGRLLRKHGDKQAAEK